MLTENKLRHHINEIITQLDKYGTVPYSIAVHQFQQFVARAFKEAQDSNEVSFFLDELFIAISLSQLSHNSVHYLALIIALIDVNLGNKLSKAKRIARDLNNIQLTKDNLFYYLLRKLLKWLSKSLKSSIQVILLKADKACKDKNNTDNYIAGLKLYSMMIKYFSSSFEDNFTKIEEVIFNGISSNNEEIVNEAIETLKTIMRSDDSVFYNLEIGISSKLISVLNGDDLKLFCNVVKASYEIIKIKPDLKGCFILNQLPLNLLQEKDMDAQISCLRLIPFAYMTTGLLFKNEIITKLLRFFRSLIIKKSQSRKDALISLADILFLHRDLQKKDIKIIGEIRSLVLESIDCDQSIYALISIISTDYNRYKNDFNIINSYSLNKLMVKGLFKFLENNLSVQKTIQKHVIYNVCSILFSSNPNKNQICLAFKLMIRLNIDESLLTIPLIFQISIYLTHESLEIRRIAIDFFLFYQNKTKSVEISQLLLSLACSEIYDDLRLKILNNVYINSNQEVISLLQAFIHDSNSKVRREALKSLTKLVKENAPNVKSLLTEFLLEKTTNKNTISREDIDCFLVISQTLGNDNYFLQPFAKFLIQNILTFGNKIPSDFIQLLSEIIHLSPKDVNISILVDHLKNYLIIHSSRRKLNSCLHLFCTALDYTDLKYLIYTKYSHLYINLINISNLTENEVSRELLLETLTKIGSFKSSVVQELKKNNENIEQKRSIKTVLYYINKSNTTDPMESLTFASVGLCLSIIFTILNDEKISTLHSIAIESLFTILKTFRQIGDELEKWLLKKINYIVVNGSSSIVTNLLTNMSVILSVLGKRIKPLIPHIFDFICLKWTAIDKSVLIRITEWLVIYVEEDFEMFIPQIANLFCNNFDSYGDKIVDDIFSAFVSFGEQIRKIDYIVYPVLLKWILYNVYKTKTCLEILPKFQEILVLGGSKKYIAQIIRTIIQIAPLNTNLHAKLLDILCVVAVQNKESFLMYLPRIKIVLNINIVPLFSEIIKCLKMCIPLNGDALALVYSTKKSQNEIRSSKGFTAPIGIRKNTKEISLSIPQEEWEESQWYTWCTKTFSTLVRNSRSRAISSCFSLVELNSGIRDLIYPIAFVLEYLGKKDDLKKILDIIFSSKKVPNNVIRYFLNALQVMESLNIKIPVNTNVIAEVSLRAGFLEQSLRAYENLFSKEDPYVTEQLIKINNKLGLKLAANGILKYAEKLGIEFSHDIIYESLGLWEEALHLYDLKLKEAPNDSILFYRKVHCFQKLAKYKELKEVTHGTNSIYEALANWYLFDRDEFQKIVSKISENRSNAKIFHILNLILTENYNKAINFLSSLRSEYINKIFPIISEDYEIAISDFATIAIESNLEEVIMYNKMNNLLKSSIPEKREYANKIIENITLKWNYLFDMIPDETMLLYSFVSFETLSLNFIQMENHWIRLIDNAISSNNLQIASSIINYLKPKINDYKTFSLKIKYYECKLIWAENKIDEAISNLYSILSSIQDNILFEKASLTLSSWLTKKKKNDEAYKILKNLDHNNNDAKILWIKVNMNNFKLNNNKKYLNEAFVASIDIISKTNINTLSYLLRILSVLFESGSKEIYDIFTSKNSQISAHKWIQVIPQLIGRMGTCSSELREIISSLIYSIGEIYPQPVIYSLLIPFKSEIPERKMIANNILEKLRLKFSDIVDGVLRIAHEFIRVGFSWWELSYNIIDEASRAYYTNGNKEEMCLLLSSLNEFIKSSPETFFEVLFLSRFGQSLQNADNYLNDYKENGDEFILNPLWQLLSSVFNKLRVINKEMKNISLKDASPFLYEIQDSKIGVPGMFTCNKSLITINKFKQILKIIKSKQRPRKIVIFGSNGQKYKFLLKANEDTRLDERVMQLFSYINSFVENSNLQLKSRLKVSTYKVIPLTRKVGLIGWVPKCTTLFDLIKQYRNKYKIELEQEYSYLKKNYPNYDYLPLPKKKEAFEKCIEITDGNDIKHILFSGTKAYHDWLERRTNYSTSLAMNSMLGYILGLGDRHLCNIMMQNNTSKLVHIDFGDCFEVALSRNQYPEKVPFRLTRMLLNSLEVSKIEGTFRSCCEEGMLLLRNNNTHIMYLLESFIYDPLILWTENEKDYKNNDIMKIVNRIKDKLTGKDFSPSQKFNVSEQVDALIKQATDPSNLCQMYKGWSPWW